MASQENAARQARPATVGPGLHVFMHGREIAQLRSSREGRAKLTYLEGATQITRGLSCSLPAAGIQYSGERVTNWLGGLLPDRGEVLARWRATYALKRLDAYALLWHVGEDVAGAARFVRPDHLVDADRSDVTQPLTEEEIGQRIRSLAQDATSWSPSEGTGQFSLAGAQAKFALARSADGWVEPSGSLATTHIFKPAIPHMADQDLNEHLTMRLAHAAGLPVAPTEVVEFDGARTLVVTRFDRYVDAQGSWHRLHQEDAVQALGIASHRKYESQGGPGVRELVALLTDNVTGGHRNRDVNTLLDAVAFNWLTVGTDAHARNYALLHHGQATRLAPLYDMNSFLPYASEHPSHLAMRIGFTQSDPAQVSRSDWGELARDCRVDDEFLIERVRLMAERLLSNADAVLLADDAAQWGSELPLRLRHSLAVHIEACLLRL
jgi:serine/threonine-protein kinase HipA